jgi:hypothetical protein
VVVLCKLLGLEILFAHKGNEVSRQVFFQHTTTPLYSALMLAVSRPGAVPQPLAH